MMSSRLADGLAWALVPHLPGLAEHAAQIGSQQGKHQHNLEDSKTVFLIQSMF